MNIVDELHVNPSRYMTKTFGVDIPDIYFRPVRKKAHIAVGLSFILPYK